MKKISSTLSNMIMSLGLITVLSGGLLGVVYSATKEPIAEQKVKQLSLSISEVAPPYDNDPEADKWDTVIDGIDFTVYPAYEEGCLAGAAVRGATMDGFSGEISVMCGFNSDGTIRDYRVLQHAETPGLGSKMEEWFRNPTGARSVIGLNPSSPGFRVSKDPGGKVDGITAATISSRAFLSAMRNAYEAYQKYSETQKR